MPITPATNFIINPAILRVKPESMQLAQQVLNDKLTLLPAEAQVQLNSMQNPANKLLLTSARDALTGVGTRIARFLESKGIQSQSQLKSLNPENLIPVITGAIQDSYKFFELAINRAYKVASSTIKRAAK